jgi:hypothetical protein
MAGTKKILFVVVDCIITHRRFNGLSGVAAMVFGFYS